MWLKPDTYAKTRSPIGSAYSITPEVYSCNNFLRAEREALWERQWFAVEHVQAISKPGDVVVVDVLDQSFILTCGKDKKINAFFNVCSHRGAKLCKANGNKKRLNCPYHNWSYNLKGNLVGAPFFDRDNFNKKDHGLKPVRVEVRFGIIWLNMDNNAPGLMDSLQGGPTEILDYPWEEMDLVGRANYTPRCNWKILAENFVEWYHIPAVHPGLDRFSKPHHHVDNQGDGKYVGFVTNPLTPTGTVTDLAGNWNLSPGQEELAAKAPFQFDPRNTAFFYHIFPNVSITIYPHSTYTLIMLPTNDPMRTVEKLSFLQHPGCRLAGEADETFTEKRQTVYDFVKEVNAEDVEICEGVAKGVLQNSYRGGMFSPEHEWTTYRFQNLVADVMTSVPQRPGRVQTGAGWDFSAMDIQLGTAMNGSAPLQHATA